MTEREQPDGIPAPQEHDTAITFDDVFKEFNRGIKNITSFQEALARA